MRERRKRGGRERGRKRSTKERERGREREKRIKFVVLQPDQSEPLSQKKKRRVGVSSDSDDDEGGSSGMDDDQEENVSDEEEDDELFGRLINRNYLVFQFPACSLVACYRSRSQFALTLCFLLFIFEPS